MKVATWNVNSITARLPHVLRWMDGTQPDVLCLQETKCVDERFPRAPFMERGYAVETFGERAYTGDRHATYLARRALMPVFVDVTERAPTFRLAPLDRTDAAERRSWIQVWTPVDEAGEAWQALLHRPFRGLDPARYEQPF